MDAEGNLKHEVGIDMPEIKIGKKQAGNNNKGFLEYDVVQALVDKKTCKYYDRE